MGIAAIVEFRPIAGKEAEVEKVLREMIQPCRAEAGSLRYDLMRRQTDGVFVLSEAYADAEAVKAHRASAHYARYREQIEPLLAGPIEPVRLDMIEPEAG